MEIKRLGGMPEIPAKEEQIGTEPSNPAGIGGTGDSIDTPGFNSSQFDSQLENMFQNNELFLKIQTKVQEMKPDNPELAQWYEQAKSYYDAVMNGQAAKPDPSAWREFLDQMQWAASQLDAHSGIDQESTWGSPPADLQDFDPDVSLSSNSPIERSDHPKDSDSSDEDQILRHKP